MSLLERKGLRICAVTLAGILCITVLVSGAFQVTRAIEDGILPRTTFTFLAFLVLAATAAYLAGRSEGEQAADAATERNRSRSRLQTDTATLPRTGDAALLRLRTGERVDRSEHVSAGASAPAVVPLKTRFLEEISQELRAPVTSISLAARIIRKHFENTPEVVNHFGATLLAEAARLSQTIDEFVELARMESGVVEWRDSEVDAADLIQRAVAEIEPIAVGAGVSIGFTMEPELPPLHVDRDRLAQALAILLAGAVSGATEGSEVVIQIAGAHGGWVFSVGGATSAYTHSAARKVLVRRDTSEMTDALPEARGGRRLGLCLCREIVHHYQGRFWHDGGPGESACVRFTVPYRQHRRTTEIIAETKRPETGASSTPVGVGTTISEGDLVKRREFAAKMLRERADAIASGAKPVAAAALDTSQSPLPAMPAEENSVRPFETDLATVTADSSQQDAEHEPVLGESEAVDAATPPEAAVEAAIDEVLPVEPSPLSAAQETDSIAELEVDDAPVHAPVSGTMIAVHHRYAVPQGAPNGGLPALHGAHQSTSPALQSSEELLLEISEARSPSDARELIALTGESRAFASAAPGNLPSVAGQHLPASGGRGGYAPARRRMVAAPWVVRTAATAAPSAARPATEPEDPELAAARRARLNERLAKRLGIRRGPTATTCETEPTTTAHKLPSRPRRLG